MLVGHAEMFHVDNCDARDRRQYLYCYSRITDSVVKNRITFNNNAEVEVGHVKPVAVMAEASPRLDESAKMEFKPSEMHTERGSVWKSLFASHVLHMVPAGGRLMLLIGWLVMDQILPLPPASCSSHTNWQTIVLQAPNLAI